MISEYVLLTIMRVACASTNVSSSSLDPCFTLRVVVCLSHSLLLSTVTFTFGIAREDDGVVYEAEADAGP